MSSLSLRRAPRVKLLCALVASCFAAEGFANPTGPSVVSGSASFSTVGKALTVTNSPNAIINWQGFSIGAGEITRFQQQNAASAVLNRVVGQDPSAIFGTLSSNGRVFLINPNGVLFGQGSRIDVAGLVASTLNITNQDFLAGRLNFQAGAVAGSITNQGEIVSSSGGRIYLIAPDVQNHGLISSPGGDVLLAAGKTVSLVDADVPNLKIEVQSGGEALNVGKIIADGGRAGIYAGLINQRGIVRADSVSKDATGKIVFRASDTTILDDGSVTSAVGAKGGEIQVLGNKVGLVGTAKIDASGDAGGGTVLVGGDFQGKNPDVQNAWRTYMAPQSSIAADAITTGDGGKVVMWSDDATRAYGSISTRGGSLSGNGGFVEVSGKNWLDFTATVNTSALRGASGVLLLDPAAVIITNTADVGGSFDGGNPNIFGSGLVTSTVTWTTIKNHLTGANGGTNTNVYITTSGSGCTIPGTCGIDILGSSGDLQSSNTLRLISHEYIHVQPGAGIMNTGSGALEMYAGWNGASPTSPVLTNGAGTITIDAPIDFAGNVLLRAYSNITATGAGSLKTPNLLLSSLTGSVTANSLTNMVGTLAGEFHDDFGFGNAQSLTIGTVGGVSGISTVPSAGGAPTLQINVAGNLTVNSPISVTDGGGSTGTTSIILTSSSGNVTVNNTSVFATAGADDSSDGQPGLVALVADIGGILISNSTVAAHGGNPVDGPGGSATLNLTAFGGITANSASTIIALGKAGVGTTQPGGNANLNLRAGGVINTSTSSLNALGGAGSGAAAGVGTVLVAVNSSTGNGNPSGDITLHNVTAENVNIQQNSRGTLGAKSILRAAANSLIGASNELLMELDDTLGFVGGGSIGTSAAPIRIQTPRLEAHTHYSSPGIFISSPNAQNLQIGGVGINSGSVKGVQALAGGDISIDVSGILTLQSGAANSPCGVGTGGPICTTSGNITLRAEDMVLGHSISGTGTVALAPLTQSRQINIESSPSAGVLSLSPSEIAQVSTPGTLEIGRIDGNATMVVNTALASGNVNAGTLRLYSGNINFTTGGADIGSSGTPFAHNVELRANNDVQLTVGNVFLADNQNLTVVADRDGSGFGNVNIGGVTLQVGSTGANNGSMTLQGRNINAIVSGGGGTNIRVFGSGNQTIAAASSLVVQNNNSTVGSLIIQADGGLQDIDANGLQVIAGSGSNTNARITGGGSQDITVGSGGLQLQGGNGSAANSSATITQTSGSGTQQITVNGGGNLSLQGGSGSGNSNFARIDSGGSAQTVTFASGGNLQLVGGTVGNLNFADLRANNLTVAAQSQTITGATGITLAGGASGGGLDGSNNSLGNFARIQNSNGSQNISVGSGGITLTGGGGPLTSNFAGIFQATSTGAPGTSQTITVNNGGTISLQGGSTAQTNVINNVGNFFRGSYAMIQGNGDSQQIAFTSGGALNLTGGSIGSNNPAQVYARFGSQTISGAPSITLQGGTGGYVDVATNKNEGNFARIHSDAGVQSITASSITLTGGASGVGNHAQIFNNSASTAQSISATSISLTGGAGGGIDSGSTGQSMGNYANIQSDGTQTINAANVSLHAGAGGTENFAVIIAPTQTISVSGDLTLVGGGSAAGAVRGGGARIGGNGGASPTPTSLTLLVGGDLTMTGGSAASGGTAIGSSSLGGQTTTMEIDVGGNVTLNPGTVVDGGSRIGSPATSMAGGDISITAGGTLALNSTGPGLGTAIRTLGNLTLNAASITQGADSQIIAGGATTILASSATLGSATNDFTGAVNFNGTSLTISDANALTLGAVTASNLTANAASIGQDSVGIVAGTANLSAGSIALTTGTNDFGTVNVTSGGNVAITDANAISVGTASVGGTFDLVATSTSFLNGFSANNYSFSGGSYTLAAGTYNLGGTTTVASGASVTATGATLNAAGGTIDVAGTFNASGGSVSAGTINVTGSFNAFAGTMNVGTLNVLAGGIVSGTGTIVGNVNNSAGIVSPGASPGILTIQGNYVQGPSGVLDVQIGGLVAGTDYDQLKVIGSASLGGTLNTTLINGFVPTTGGAFTLVDATLGVSGTFATVNQPVGVLFNTFYGPTTFQVIGAAITSGGSVPAPIAPTFNQVIVSTEQLSQPLVEVIETITVAVLPPTTTTTPEGQVVPKPPVCN